MYMAHLLKVFHSKNSVILSLHWTKFSPDVDQMGWNVISSCTTLHNSIAKHQTLIPKLQYWNAACEEIPTAIKRKLILEAASPCMMRVYVCVAEPTVL